MSGNKMSFKIGLLTVLIIVSLLSVETLSIESIEDSSGCIVAQQQMNELLNQLTTRFDRFQAELKDEIAFLKKQNSEQAEEIRRLKEAAEIKEDKTASSGEKGINHKPNDSSPRALPSSCRQLETLGHTLDGFYIVQNIIDSKMKVVYCDFQPVSETRIGNLDVKTSEVHFYVQRTSSFSMNDAIIIYDREVLNVGEAMNMITGTFTAPVDGTYHFEFDGVKDNTTNELIIFLQVNGAKIGVSQGAGLANVLQSSLNASLKLKAGDKVTLYKTTGVLYNTPDYYYTHFSGRLVEEDLVVA